MADTRDPVLAAITERAEAAEEWRTSGDVGLIEMTRRYVASAEDVPWLLARVGELEGENGHLQRRLIAAGSLLNEGTYDHSRSDPCKCSSCLTLRLLREPFEAVSNGD